MKKLVLTCLMAGSALVASTSANAAPLMGGSSIDFGGYLQGSGGDGTLGGSTFIDFVNGAGGAASPGTAGKIPTYGSGTGTFAGFTCMGGQCGTINDIANLVVGAQSITNFFSLTGGNNTSPINFDLTSISSINRADSQFLTFRALGNIRYDGFDATPASFLFSAQGSNATSFSATALAAAVPEPATWAMMILGMGAVGFAMRRRKSNVTTTVGYAA